MYFIRQDPATPEPYTRSLPGALPSPLTSQSAGVAVRVGARAVKGVGVRVEMVVGELRRLGRSWLFLAALSSRPGKRELSGATLLSDRLRWRVGAMLAWPISRDSHWKPSVRGMSSSSWLIPSWSHDTISIPNLAEHRKREYDVSTEVNCDDVVALFAALSHHQMYLLL